MKKSKAWVWFGIVLLIGIEQGIKLIINTHYLNLSKPIFAPYLYFQPMFNRDYSWINSMLQIGIGKWAHVFFVVVMIALIISFYAFMQKTRTVTTVMRVMFIFIVAGATCSLIDKVFWDGSLDYIYLNGYFTFDLKDVYVNVFNGLLVLMVIINYKAISREDDTDWLKEFGHFLAHGLRLPRARKDIEEDHSQVQENEKE